ncbi:hypothetical protein [Leifsonia xyli]|uniref:hypothetical protein n=1 Tax=Leifsonia xyli TaxID=1575 RepID=UPI0004114AC3|nr:hypothetical protein [Leifsonia xyli]
MGDFPRAYARGLEAIDAGRSLDDARTAFEERNPSIVPFDREFQEHAIRALLLLDADNEDLPLGAVVWNAVPVLGLLLLFFAGSIVRRQWVSAGLLGILLTRAAIVFATAPARFFMYYFFAYLVGGVVVLFLGVRGIDRALARRDERLAGAEQTASADRASTLADR